MRKLYCDRCKKEMDLHKENDIHVWFAFPNGETEEWDFCEECVMSVKRSVINNLIDYETAQSNAQIPTLDAHKSDTTL